MRRSPRHAQKAFEKRGLKFRVGAKVTKLAKTKAGVAIALEAGGKAETLEADAPSSPWASTAMSRTWAWRPWA